MFLAGGSCNDKGSSEPEDTADTGDTDPGLPPNNSTCTKAKAFAHNHGVATMHFWPYDDVCEIRVRRPVGTCGKVYGVRLTGGMSEPAAPPGPGSVFVKPPGDCGSSGLNGVSPSVGVSEWTVDYADDGVCDPANDSGDALNCNSGVQAGSDDWVIWLPLPPSNDCEEYGDLDLHFYSEDSNDCGGQTNSTTSACTPGINAEVQLIHRDWSDHDGDGVEHGLLVPVLRTGDAFPERAWITGFVVDDWGDAEALHLVRTGSSLQLNGDTIVGGDLETLTPAAPRKSFPRGQLHMGTTFALDGLPADQTFKAPSGRVSWSCSHNVANPHYSVVAAPQAYGRRLNELGLGMTHTHRLLLRLYETEGYGTLELQGRHWDAISFPIQSIGPNWAFTVEDSKRGFSAAGVIQPEGVHKQVAFTQLQVGELNLGTPSWTMVQFDED